MVTSTSSPPWSVDTGVSPVGTLKHKRSASGGYGGSHSRWTVVPFVNSSERTCSPYCMRRSRSRCLGFHRAHDRRNALATVSGASFTSSIRHCQGERTAGQPAGARPFVCDVTVPEQEGRRV